MRKIGLSILAVVALSNVSFAGGNLEPVVEPVMITPAVDDYSVSGFYAGIGASVASTRETDLNFFDEEEGQDRTGDVTLLAGYEINEYVAVEGRYQLSVQEEDILDKTSWGVFVKPQYYVTPDFKVYGLLGYGGFDLSVNKTSGGQTTQLDMDATGFQWGLGASYEVYDNISIYIDYLNLIRDVAIPTFVNQNVELTSDAFTIGVIYHF